MKLNQMASADEDLLPFTLVLQDPAGNSHIQSFLSPLPDPQLSTRHYKRSAEEDASLGGGSTFGFTHATNLITRLSRRLGAEEGALPR